MQFSNRAQSSTAVTTALPARPVAVPPATIDAALPPLTRAAPRPLAARLFEEAWSSLGYLLLRAITDWVLFPDGPAFMKVRGRIFTHLFGWGRGVGVARGVVVQDLGSIRVGAYTRIAAGASLAGPLEIGEHCFLGVGSIYYPGTIIGDRVAIAPRVCILTQWHEVGLPSQRAGALQKKPTRIGSGACVNAGALVLAGCHVGEGAVVAGGAKVTRRVPPNVIVAGDPAAIVHRIES